MGRLQDQLHQLIYGVFQATKPTVDTFRIRIYGVLNLLLCLMDELRNVVGNEAIDRLNVGQRLTQAERLQDIDREMDDILDALANASGLRKGDGLPDWVPQVQQYIGQKFRDINLTVSSVADAVCMPSKAQAGARKGQGRQGAEKGTLHGRRPSDGSGKYTIYSRTRVPTEYPQLPEPYTTLSETFPY